MASTSFAADTVAWRELLFGRGAWMLRSEMRERLQYALEAMTKRLAPSLAGLDADSMEALLAAELVHVVDGVEREHLGRLAEIATGGGE